MAILEEPIKEVLLIKNFIAGEWVESKGEIKDVVNPATDKTIAKVPISTKDELDAAVKAAQEAFPGWRRTTPLARARCLFRLKELLEENFEELSRIQTQEHGKTIDESRGETRRGIENVEVATGIPTFMQGYFSEDVATDIDEWLVPTPLGVFGIIAPFNFPFMIPLWSAPYAVATGNCVVIKPSSEVPLTQMRLAELVDEAGIPPGVWNVVNGGRAVVSGMLEHPGIVGITFVGSTPTAKYIYEMCGKTGKRVIAQGGAKNFMVIMPDADVSRTIPALMTSFFGNTGQRCLSGANLLIVGDDDRFYNSFMEAVVDAASRIVIGNGLDESVQMGPVRDKEKKERIIGYIESGIQQGAKLRLDGRRDIKIAGNYPETCFLGPTIFENVTPDMKIGTEEIFGPVMSVMRAKNLDEAIEMCNASPFGNGNAIFTSSGKNAREFQYRITSGNVGINIGIVAPMAFFPFSGMKDSFLGILHTQGQEAVRFFTESKVVIQRWL
ncbi:malonate-semialdehyde dehydrogenase (acetylating) / methylmalonate-semialdehyde dehydrogenase [Candidatus Hakubella thermalkaliphila]|uniref:methylmalonate-semialdehyde dehydrogenase (CoA acylating) n=1 Tax=Candidatus Hakubella thermalkaliphila TaxID=2754717 RepID=A0A6V8PJE3_9ACTN|nr:malonate-semialdehyde dehydrogenase (acetylating) / methylmalonate-semialdehyde dehydrogenase [Candidatus Hakubella thermalkaliphila]